jgi:hypothetical protein
MYILKVGTLYVDVNGDLTPNQSQALRLVGLAYASDVRVVRLRVRPVPADLSPAPATPWTPADPF